MQRQGGAGASHGGMGGQSGYPLGGGNFLSHYAPKRMTYGNLYEPNAYGSGGGGSAGGIGKWQQFLYKHSL